jgi:hypothetical protein
MDRQLLNINVRNKPLLRAGITSPSVFVSALTAELVSLRLGPVCDTRQRVGVVPGSPACTAPLQGAAPHLEPCGDSQSPRLPAPACGRGILPKTSSGPYALKRLYQL